MSMMFGYHYKEPKRGNGFSFTVKDAMRFGDFHIASCTQASAMELRREFIRNGHKDHEIIIEKN